MTCTLGLRTKADVRILFTVAINASQLMGKFDALVPEQRFIRVRVDASTQLTWSSESHHFIISKIHLQRSYGPSYPTAHLSQCCDASSVDRLRALLHLATY
jgi:hypothetical protein